MVQGLFDKNSFVTAMVQALFVSMTVHRSDQVLTSSDAVDNGVSRLAHLGTEIISRMIIIA